MKKIPKWFWLAAILLLILMAVFLKLTFGLLTSSLGLGSLWTPMIMVAILGVIIYSLMAPFKMPSLPSMPSWKSPNWPILGKALWNVLKFGTIAILIIFSSKFGYDNREAIKGKIISMSTTIPYDFKGQKQWKLTFERSHDDENWNAEQDTFVLDVKIIKLDENRLEFVAQTYNKKALRTIECRFIGKRLKVGGRRYAGMWTQGKKGDPHYIHQTWEMDMIREDRFSGYITSSDGVKYTSFLEKK